MIPAIKTYFSHNDIQIKSSIFVIANYILLILNIIDRLLELLKL